MELWWNLDILWWNLDRFEHKFDGNITNWPCWSEGKLGTGPFTWLGQGFQTNFLEIPFQKGKILSIYGQNYGHLRSFTVIYGILTVFQSQQNRLYIHPCFLQCFAEQPPWLRLIRPDINCNSGSLYIRSIFNPFSRNSAKGQKGNLLGVQ